jgi:hypothetical protein
MVYEMERTHVDSVYPFDVLVTKDEGVSPRKKHLDVCMSVDVPESQEHRRPIHSFLPLSAADMIIRALLQLGDLYHVSRGHLPEPGRQFHISLQNKANVTSQSKQVLGHLGAT